MELDFCEECGESCEKDPMFGWVCEDCIEDKVCIWDLTEEEEVMVTNEWLQAHLQGETQTLTGGFVYKAPAPRISMVSGASISVQASQSHYSTPRLAIGPYSEVEVAFPEGVEPDWWESHDGVMAWVPINDVLDFINSQGGV